MRATEFRLVEADFESLHEDIPWRRDLPPGPLAPERHVKFMGPVADSGSTYLTTFIGRNGCGKSRILALLAETFQRLGFGETSRGIPVKYLRYLADGRVCEVRKNRNGHVLCYLEGRRIALRDLPLPERVVSLTQTPFDKFPLERRPPDRIWYHRFGRNVYRYLGLRDRSHRASILAILYNAIENLLEASTSEQARRRRVAGVFDFLKYRSSVNVVYTISGYRKLLTDLASGDIFGRTNSAHRMNVLRRMSRAQRDQRLSQEQIRDYAQSCLDAFGQHSYITLPISFEGPPVDADLFNRLQFFRKMRAVGLKAVELEKQDGSTFDLRKASSGELSIATAFLSLASVILDGSLILIDEPEISLHPAWQAAYVNMLVELFKDFKGCHFAIATHSPLILSDVNAAPSHAVSLDEELELDAAQIGGRSSDYLLVRAFGLGNPSNLYIKQQVVGALRMLSAPELDAARWRSAVDELVYFRGILPEEDPSSRVINSIIANSAAVIRAK